jgi:5-hydroxyisourate hydrolase
MAGITTHVLDTGKGRPAQGVRVTLSIFRDDWNEVARGVTDADGRLRTLTDGVELQRATYRLTFETAAYGNTFFPEVSIVFSVENPGTHYHVPLLLSPFGYSTYRGS